MRFKKQLLSLLLATGIAYQLEAKKIHIETANGDTETVETTLINKISFSDKNILIYLNDKSVVSYNLNEILSLNTKNSLNTGFKKANISQELIIINNPVHDLLLIKDNKGTYTTGDLKFYNMSGALVLSSSFDFSNNCTEVDVSKLSKGTYICVASGTENTTVLTIIKQ